MMANRTLAFSLIEMLVILAVVAVVAGVGITQIAGIRGSAAEASAIHNARQIAMVASLAHAAGLDFVGPTNLAGSVANVVAGGLVPAVDNNPFAGRHFGLPGLSAQDQAGAVRFLDLRDGLLVYTGPAATGGASSGEPEDVPLAPSLPADWTPVQDGQEHTVPGEFTPEEVTQIITAVERTHGSWNASTNAASAPGLLRIRYRMR